MDLGLCGARAIVTGGTRGIGRAVVTTLLAEGASVAFCARDADEVRATVAELGVEPGRLHGRQLDVRDREQLPRFVASSADDLGGVDVLVSNVSGSVGGDGDAYWQGTFELDLLQHVHLVEEARPHLESGDGGSAVFVSSIAANLATLPPHERAYGVMKAGLNNLAAQLAQELGPLGVRVNSVAPGPVLAPGGYWESADERLRERVRRLSALGTLASAQDVADVVTFLASPRAAHVTGANVRVDGGTLKSVL